MQMKMQMKMSQQLIMTPQLQQAIKLLQLSRAELEELIEKTPRMRRLIIKFIPLVKLHLK